MSAQPQHGDVGEYEPEEDPTVRRAFRVGEGVGRSRWNGAVPGCSVSASRRLSAWIHVAIHSAAIAQVVDDIISDTTDLDL